MMSTPPRGGDVGRGAPPMSLASPPLFASKTSPSSQQVIPGTPEEGMEPVEEEVTEGDGHAASMVADDSNARPSERVVMKYGTMVVLMKLGFAAYPVGERRLT